MVDADTTLGGYYLEYRGRTHPVLFTGEGWLAVAATEDELEQARRDVTRALVVAQRGVASARASREIREQFENLEGMDEEDIDQLAVELSKGAGGKGGPGDQRRPPRTSSGPRSSRRSRTPRS